MENMSIHLEYKEANCTEFMSGGKKETVSVTIIPLRITEDEDNGQVRISTGCSMWKGCDNARCQFSGKTYGPKPK